VGIALAKCLHTISFRRITYQNMLYISHAISSNVYNLSITILEPDTSPVD